MTRWEDDWCEGLQTAAEAYRRLNGWEMTAKAGRWLVDKTAIYQPSTHYPTTCYTPAGRYGRFFCYKTKKEAIKPP